MAKITNYQTLKTELQNYLNRANLISELPQFIQAAEARVKALVPDIPEMEVLSTGTLSGSTLALPTGYLGTLSLFVADGADFCPLLSTDRAHLRSLQNNSGVPSRYLEVAGVLQLGPTPDSTRSYEWTYLKKFTELSANTDTNWIIDEHPTAYLYGALSEGYLFGKDEPRAGTFEQKFQQKISEIQKSIDLRKYPPGQVQMRVA